jgi:hypothetical protein
MISSEHIQNNSSKINGIFSNLYFFVRKTTKQVGIVTIALFKHIDKALERATSF